MLADPKSTKRHWYIDCIFILWRSAKVKAAPKMLVKSTPADADDDSSEHTRKQQFLFVLRFIAQLRSVRETLSHTHIFHVHQA